VESDRGRQQAIRDKRKEEDPVAYQAHLQSDRVRQQASRDKLKEDPVAHQAHLEKERVRKQASRDKLEEDKASHQAELAKRRIRGDDLPDGGSGIFADTIRAIHKRVPACQVEVLTPDFQGVEASLATVMEASPEVFNHNIETVPRLFPRVRPKSLYERSLGVLRRAGELDSGTQTKSGLMVGLGETMDEVKGVLRDLREQEVKLITIGQYLRPSLKHIRCERFWHPDEFAEVRAYGESLGFAHVEAGPLVRSSYHAHQQVQAAVAAAV